MKKISDLIDAYFQKEEAYQGIASLLENPDTSFLFDQEVLEQFRSEASGLQKEMCRLQTEIMRREGLSDQEFYTLLDLN